MSRYKNVLTGIQKNVKDINIPAFEGLDLGNATPNDVQNILNDLRTAQTQSNNPVEIRILGNAIDDIMDLPGENFQ